MKTVILIYYPEQVPLLKRYLEGNEAVIPVAFGADVEYALAKEAIPFRSGESLRKADSAERLTYAEKVGQGVFSDVRMEFLSHRSVPYGKVYAHALQRYLAVFLYYADMIASLIAEDSPEKIIVIQSHRMAFIGDILADFMERAIEDAAKLVSERDGIEVEVLPTVALYDMRRQKKVFLFKRAFFGIFLTFFNAAMRLFHRPKPLRLLISDIWRNFGPYISELPEAEAVLWERTEFKNIGWKKIWKYRMRFMHSDAFLRRVHRTIACNAAREALSRWSNFQARSELIESDTFIGLSLRKTIIGAVDHIVRAGSYQAVLDIEDTFAMLKHLRPHVVLVRASESMQTHFAFLCYVARELSIPSVEIQHGVLYLGQGSIASHVAAEYIATYGPLASREFSRLGISLENLPPTGSPRFDSYATLGAGDESLNPGTLEVAYGVSTIDPGLWIDTYDLKGALKALAKAADMPNVSTKIAVRPDSPYAPFLKELIIELSKKNPNFSVAGMPLQKLLRQSDVFIMGHSTVLFEALLAGKPVIYDASVPLYASMKKETALLTDIPIPIAGDSEEMAALLKQLSERQEMERLRNELHRHMQEQYVLDGTASSRVAALVRHLAA